MLNCSVGNIEINWIMNYVDYDSIYALLLQNSSTFKLWWISYSTQSRQNTIIPRSLCANANTVLTLSIFWFFNSNQRIVCNLFSYLNVAYLRIRRCIQQYISSIVNIYVLDHMFQRDVMTHSRQEVRSRRDTRWRIRYIRWYVTPFSAWWCT